MTAEELQALLDEAMNFNEWTDVSKTQSMFGRLINALEDHTVAPDDARREQAEKDEQIANSKWSASQDTYGMGYNAARREIAKAIRRAAKKKP